MQVMLVMPPGRDHDVQDMPRTRYAPPKSSLHCTVLYCTVLHSKNAFTEVATPEMVKNANASAP
jgi:hypothetical protein